MLGLAGVALILAGLATIASIREANRLTQCSYLLRSIALALANYQSAEGTFPPAYVADAEGRPLYSWRVLIQPYLSDEHIDRGFHRDEPWDSPANRTFVNATGYFSCEANPQRGITNVFALSAPGTAMPGTGGVRPDQITDGPASTLLLVESSQGQVPWTAPVDIDPRTGRLTNWPDPSLPGPTTFHRSNRINVATVDSQVFNVDATRLRRALLPASTIAGGEPMSLDLHQGSRP
jgi:hypothetical protein